MTDTEESRGQARLATKPRALQWLVLIVLSVIFSTALELGHMPAAPFLGPMAAGIVAGTNGALVRVPKMPFGFAQAIIGILIASSISPSIFSSFLADWPLFLSVVLLTVAASSFLGWLISRWKILPGTTGVWGASPGGATAMVLMAEAFGADARLVAFMQYLRVIFVSLAAALIARLWVDTSGVAAPVVPWFPVLDALPFAATIGVAMAGCLLATVIKIPSPFFLGTFLLAVILHLGLDLTFQLPQWLLAINYALVGWTIGLNFTRAILLHAARALPQIVGATLALIAFCGGLAWMLSDLLGVDPLTAYLATSPGGMDTVAIIAAASKDVDISFVMALQIARLMIVMMFGPAIARMIAKWVA